MVKKIDTVDGLNGFNKESSVDSSFHLYETLSNSDEKFKEFWDKFSDFYYISCSPFKKDVKKWKNIPEIYDILKRCMHMANGFPLEILIGKYSEESMEKAREITEQNRKEYEWFDIEIVEPKPYIYIVGFFGGTAWRTNEEIIKQIKVLFPDKIKSL